MNSETLLTAAVTIVFGALAGGLTNAVAIWMLFHPYTPRGISRLKVQGAIPKNKSRLAKTIGRTVGERLLTSDDFARQLSAPAVETAFQNAVRHFTVSMLESERGVLRDELPPGVIAELQGAFDVLAPTIAERLAEFAATEEFKAAVGRFLTRTTDEVGHLPLGGVLTEARRRAIADQLDDWVAEAVQSPGLERAIGDWLDRQLTTMAADHTPLLDRLPAALVAAVEREIAGYLPLALDRISSALGDPAARANIHRALHDLFQRFVTNLLIHERIVARLMVTEKTIARLLDTFERDGVEHITHLLDEPEMQSQVARSVNDAVVKFLRRPLAEHLAALGPDRVTGIKETVQGHIITALRDGTTRQFVVDKADQALEAAEHRTWGDVLKHLPPDRAAEWAGSAIATDRVREWMTEGTRLALNALLDRRIGRPADRLPAGSVDRITAALTPPLWDWIQRQVPTVVAQLNVQEMVEEKVLGFSLERIEQIVRATTQRELDVIVRLGYLLGAIVGGVAFLVTVLLP